jgi:hypothetical protein
MDQGELISKMKYFERTEHKHHREYIKAHNHCVLCGTALELQHIAKSQDSEITEEAFCPNCEVKTRAKTHTVN